VLFQLLRHCLRFGRLLSEANSHFVGAPRDQTTSAWREAINLPGPSNQMTLTPAADRHLLVGSTEYVSLSSPQPPSGATAASKTGAIERQRMDQIVRDYQRAAAPPSRKTTSMGAATESMTLEPTHRSFSRPTRL
jgi:hypothetical protein